MLVRIQNASMSVDERRLVDWLRGWNGDDDPRGVAIVNCNVLGRDRLHQVDAVVWTPQACVVVEVKGFTDRQHGELRPTPNGPWLVDGQPAALATSTRRNPLEQLRDNVFSTKSALEPEVGEKFVAGLVFVVPASGAQLMLADAKLPTGVEVVLGDHEYRVRRYFTDLARRRTAWSADEVARAFHVLSLDNLLPSADELATEGFEGPVTFTPEPYQPTTSTTEQPYVEPGHDPESVVARPKRESPLLQYSPWRLYPRDAPGSKLDTAALRILLLLGMIVAVLWVIWFIVEVAVA